MMDERFIYRLIMTRELAEGPLSSLTFNLEDIRMMIYYTYLIDPIQAERLYKSTISRFLYEIDGDLGYDVIEEEEDIQQLPLSEMQFLMDFLNQEIIPSLEADVDIGNEETFLSIWELDNSSAFWSMLSEEGGIFNIMLPIHCDNLDLIPADFLFIFQTLSSFYQEVLNENINYKVYREK